MREIRSIRLFSLIVSSLILMLLMVRTQYLYSQNDKKAQTENDSLDISRIAADVDRFMEAQLRSQGHSKIYSDTALITKLFSVSPNTPNIAEAYSDWYEGQMYALRGDLGFRLSSSYQENFEPGILTDEDITYLRRLYLGLDWDLLGGGLLSNRAKIRSLKAQQELAREEYHTQSKEGHYLFLHSYFTYIFKKEKQGLLSRRKEVIDEQLRIARRMYLIRLTSWEKLLELESKAQEVNILLNDNQVYYSSRMKEGLAGLFDDETLMYDFLPVFEIDAEKMIEIFNRSADRERMLELQTERYRLENWKFSDYTFRPYLRYNLMQTDATTTRNYATAGFTASIPLRFRSPYREALNARLRIAGNEQQTESLAAGNELLNHFYEYQYRKMQYTSFYFKKLKLEERLRKEMVMREIGRASCRERV